MRSSSLMLAAAIAFGPGSAFAQAEISQLQGKATLHRGSAGARVLKKGMKLQAGDRVKTAAKTRVELIFPDRSRIRIGSSSDVVLDQAKFSGGDREAVEATVSLGRIWAKVAKAVGAKSKFEVHTKNAVSGVRGTSFAVLAAADSSALVRVYAGTVGVKKKPAIGRGNRVQVPGPQPIDKTQWEEIVATAMKQVKVSALGELSPAESFEDQGEELEWAQWNQALDDKTGLPD